MSRSLLTQTPRQCARPLSLVVRRRGPVAHVGLVGLLTNSRSLFRVSSCAHQEAVLSGLNSFWIHNRRFAFSPLVFSGRPVEGIPRAKAAVGTSGPLANAGANRHSIVRGIHPCENPVQCLTASGSGSSKRRRDISLSMVRIAKRLCNWPRLHMKSQAPPNMALQRTCRLVTRFAYANPAPTRQAAELGC